jgi:diguanylate cyclase (GGDEF)-like protein
MREEETAQECELLQRLRDTLTEAAMEAGPGLSGASTRLLLTCITLLGERATHLAALSAPKPPSSTRPDGMPERRGQQRTTLSHVSLLRDVDPVTLNKLLTSCSFRDLAPDEILLTPGRANRHVYIVMSGSVRVHLDDLTGPPYVEIPVGECVGELSILGETKVTAHVLGNEAARLMVIDQDLLWLLIEHSPQLARKLLYTLSHRVGSDNLILRRSLRRQRESELNANLDALTGIANRRGLTRYFDELVEKGATTNQPLSLMMMDIDHFKRFNDTHGHVLGDNVLCAVAGILADHAGEGLAARYGGEEFSLVLPGFDLDQTCRLANTIREKIQEVQLWTAQGELIPPITISIGVKCMEAHDTLQTLVHDADSALYCAKRSGRNCVRQHPLQPAQDSI